MNTAFYRQIDQILFNRLTTIIMYHGFTHPNDPLENYYGKHLHIQTFRKHLEYLKKYYTVISLDQFVDHCLSKEPVFKNTVVLTLDDGYESNFTLAYPLLKELNVPATIFLTTDFIEQKQFIWANRVEYAILTTTLPLLRLPLNNQEHVFDLSYAEAKKEAVHAVKVLLKPLEKHIRDGLIDAMEKFLKQKLVFDSTTPLIHRPLSWQQIQQMSQSNLIGFGSHTCSHAILARCSPEVTGQEITGSKKIIEAKIDKNCPDFCYPYGSTDTYNNQTKEALQNAGYRSALTTVTGKNSPKSDVFTLKRVGTSNLVNMDNFTASLSTTYKNLRRFRY